jgi:NO-binding membrane sensor protein with MHYT domain
MERTTEADSAQWFGVTIWDPGRIYLALAIAVFIVAVFVALGLLERAENRRRADEYAAEQRLRSPRPVR